MLDTLLNWELDRMGSAARYKALPIAILATAIGWLIVSRMERPPEVTKRARTVGRRLHQRLEYAGELASGFRGRLKTKAGAHDTPKSRGPRRKVVTDEPMAGYGA
jgi:hypothetical protein